MVTTLTIFIVVRATPGDPVELMLGMQTSPDAVEALREKFHLNEPLYQQYLIWLGDVLTGDLGSSIRLNRPVTQMLGERIWVSLQLATAAMLFALIVSIPLGIVASIRRNTWVDYLATGYTVLGFSVPNFALALILIYVFSVNLDWLPITGIGSSTSRRARPGRPRPLGRFPLHQPRARAR